MQQGDIRAENRTALPHWKRTTDLTGSLLALILLSPLFLLIALLVKLASPGPVFYSQERIGFRGRPFRIWKFRSMQVHNSPELHSAYLASLIQSDQPMTKLDAGADRRLIPLGWLFRATGLDELPQLFCILRGDMSLVGPRPCLPYEFEDYAPHHRARLDAVPGLTGLWQVSGKNRTTFEEMVALDVEYAQTKSFWLDLVIMAKTPAALFTQIQDIITIRQKGITS